MTAHICPKCGTSHLGYPAGTFGAETACLRALAARLGDDIGERVGQVIVDLTARRDRVLRDEGLIPDVSRQTFNLGPADHVTVEVADGHLLITAVDYNGQTVAKADRLEFDRRTGTITWQLGGTA